MRLLIVTDEMEVGGSQRQIVRLLRHIDRERFQPSVLYFRNPSHLVDELEDMGVPVIKVPKRRPLDPRFVAGLARRIRRGGYDVVHCFAFTAELWGMVAHSVNGRGGFVSSIRGRYEWYSPLQWRIKRWVSRYSDCVVSNSRAGADYALERMRLEPERVEVVYNGIEIPPPVPEASLAGLRASLGIDRGEVMGLFVGRFVEHKNLPSLVRAMAVLNESGGAPVMCLAGDGELRPELEARIVSEGLESRFRLLGQRSDVERLMQAADFVVLPSFREGLSNTILEGMAAGRPVVASKVGGNVELLEHERTGLLYPSDDHVALARAMGRLVMDAELRRRLGAAARREAERRFSIPAMVQRMEAIYERVARAA